MGLRSLFLFFFFCEDCWFSVYRKDLNKLVVIFNGSKLYNVFIESL